MSVETSWTQVGKGELLTLNEAAEVLRVPVNTVRWWRQRGVGPSFFKIGRHVVIKASDLHAWIDAQCVPPGPSRE